MIFIILIIVLLLLLIVILSTINTIYALNYNSKEPAGISKSKARDYLLKEIPVGTDFDDIVKYLKENKFTEIALYTENGDIHKKYEKDGSVKNSQKNYSGQTYVRAYNSVRYGFYQKQILISFSFDDDFKWSDIVVSNIKVRWIGVKFAWVKYYTADGRLFQSNRLI